VEFGLPATEEKKKGTSYLTIGIETNQPIKKGDMVLVDYAARFWTLDEDGDDDPTKVRICIPITSTTTIQKINLFVLSLYLHAFVLML
jgi:hypothetical protein